MRVYLIAAFAALAAAALWVSPVEAQPGALREITPGVWFRQAEEGANNIIIEMSDGLLIVDANFPTGARATLEHAKKISSKPVKYVFLTHHHGDHAYGVPLFSQAGATVIAHEGVVTEMDSAEPKGWQRAAGNRKDVAELNLPGPGRPQKTFRDRMSLGEGPRRVEFLFYGWAHTRGDGFAYLPGEKVLCTGDVIVNGPYNYLGDAHIRNWPEVIRAAQKLDVVHLLPGHGAPAGKELMDGQLRFLAELRRAAELARKEGKKPEEIAATFELPADLANWRGKSFAAQLRMTYEELSQSKPYGDIARGR